MLSEGAAAGPPQSGMGTGGNRGDMAQVGGGGLRSSMAPSSVQGEPGCDDVSLGAVGEYVSKGLVVMSKERLWLTSLCSQYTPL